MWKFEQRCNFNFSWALSPMALLSLTSLYWLFSLLEPVQLEIKQCQDTSVNKTSTKTCWKAYTGSWESCSLARKIIVEIYIWCAMNSHILSVCSKNFLHMEKSKCFPVFLQQGRRTQMLMKSNLKLFAVRSTLLVGPLLRANVETAVLQQEITHCSELRSVQKDTKVWFPPCGWCFEEHWHTINIQSDGRWSIVQGNLLTSFALALSFFKNFISFAFRSWHGFQNLIFLHLKQCAELAAISQGVVLGWFEIRKVPQKQLHYCKIARSQFQPLLPITLNQEGVWNYDLRALLVLQSHFVVDLHCCWFEPPKTVVDS